MSRRQLTVEQYILTLAGNKGIDTTSITPDSADLTQTSIGRQRYITAGVDNYFDGLIDEVRIYNRALSAEEIQDLYQATRGKFHSSKKGLTDGLVGMWSFDGPHMFGNTALDISGQGNDGALTNGPSRTIGRIGQALEFDGLEDNVSVDENSIYETIPLSIAFWIKTGDTLPSLDEERRVAGKRHSIGPWFSWYFHWDDIDNKMHFSTISSGESQTSSLSDSTLETNTWYHVTGVCDGTTNTLYMDGVAQSATAVCTSMYDSNGQLRIGDPIINEWNGIIDEFRIYNRALTPDEIKRLYNMGR